MARTWLLPAALPLLLSCGEAPPRPVGPVPGEIVGSDVRVRAFPGTDGRIVTICPGRERVVVLERSTNATDIDGEARPWYRVRVRGEEGWIFARFIALLTNEESPRLPLQGEVVTVVEPPAGETNETEEPEPPPEADVAPPSAHYDFAGHFVTGARPSGYATPSPSAVAVRIEPFALYRVLETRGDWRRLFLPPDGSAWVQGKDGVPVAGERLRPRFGRRGVVLLAVPGGRARYRRQVERGELVLADGGVIEVRDGEAAAYYRLPALRGYWIDTEHFDLASPAVLLEAAAAAGEERPAFLRAALDAFEGGRDVCGSALGLLDALPPESAAPEINTLCRRMCRECGEVAAGGRSLGAAAVGFLLCGPFSRGELAGVEKTAREILRTCKDPPARAAAAVFLGRAMAADGRAHELADFTVRFLNGSRRVTRIVEGEEVDYSAWLFAAVSDLLLAGGRYDDAAKLAETVSGWSGTSPPAVLAELYGIRVMDEGNGDPDDVRRRYRAFASRHRGFSLRTPEGLFGVEDASARVREMDLFSRRGARTRREGVLLRRGWRTAEGIRLSAGVKCLLCDARSAEQSLLHKVCAPEGVGWIDSSELAAP